MAKTTTGADMPYEAVNFTHIVPDENGNLKIKLIEEFVDSNSYAKSMEAFIAAKAK